MIKEIILKKKNSRVVILLFILVGVMIFAIFNNKTNFIRFTFENHKLNLSFNEKSISSIDELGLRINEELSNGNTEFTAKISGITNEELKSVNSYIDGYLGEVLTYGVSDSSISSRYVTFKLSVSDNYYVYDNFVNGTEIPEDNEVAQQLALKVRDILANSISEDMTDYEKELAIHDYIVKNSEYGFLEGDLEEYSYNAYGTIVMGKGVCNGYAEAFKLLLDCVGVCSKIVVGTADGVDHAWNCVLLDDKWYFVDATWDDPVPNVPERTLYSYFNVPAEFINTSHIWNESAYPKCDAIDYNYYYKSGMCCDTYDDFMKKVSDVINEASPREKVSIMVRDYDEDKYDLNFVLDTGKVKNISWQVYGDEPNVTIEMKIIYR